MRFLFHHKIVTSEAAVVTYYRGHHRTVLPVWEVSLKVCSRVILI